MDLKLIFAQASNGVIGCQGALPWYLPEDLAHFKRTTAGSPVIMGRKTWDSLPRKYRPLSGRLNVVVTRQMDWVLTRQADHSTQGVLVAHSIEEACSLCPKNSTAWVIGGAQIYAQALSRADGAVVTQIHQPFEGDAYAPVFDTSWVETKRERLFSKDGVPYSIIHYTHQRSKL